MSDEDIDELLWTAPFEPFEIFVSDGTKYTIRHREYVRVRSSSIDVEIPTRDGGRFTNKIARIALSHIVRMQPVEAKPTLLTPQEN